MVQIIIILLWYQLVYFKVLFKFNDLNALQYVSFSIQYSNTQLYLYCSATLSTSGIAKIQFLNVSLHNNNYFSLLLFLPPVVCRRVSYHIYVICVCFRIVVSKTYCVVFLVLFFFVMCTLWYQFLLIVHF
jgi:hypothetical protein